LYHKNPNLFWGFSLALNTHIMIFESPDGGKTVTVRVPHTLNKVDITVDPFDLEKMEINQLWFKWRNIVEASQTNPALKDALDRAQLIYELSRNND
jgi:hypothetical protein